MALSPSTAGSQLFRTYGSSVLEPLASETTMASDIDFIPQDVRPGESYNVSVHLQLEHGQTHANLHDAFTLNPAVDGSYQRAFLEGSEILLRGQVAYGMATKMSTSKGKSSRAYDQAVGQTIANLMESGELYRDLDLIYGPGTTRAVSLGVINSIISAAGTTLVVTLTRASWAGGMWPKLIGAKFDAFTSGGTQHNPGGAMILTAVGASQCRLTFTVAAGDIAAAFTGDGLFFFGASVVSMVGIQAVCENATTLFNINAATFPQWKAVQYAVGGALTFDKVIEGLSQAAENGLDAGCTLYCNPRTWADLMTDEASLRRYLGGKEATKSAKPGYSQLEYETNTGVVKIKTYQHMKQGIALALPTQEWKRVGSSDLTFAVPGSKNEFFWQELSGQAGFELRIYTDQAVFSENPWHSVIYSGIANTADSVPS